MFSYQCLEFDESTPEFVTEHHKAWVEGSVGQVEIKFSSIEPTGHYMKVRFDAEHLHALRSLIDAFIIEHEVGPPSVQSPRKEEEDGDD